MIGVFEGCGRVDWIFFNYHYFQDLCSYRGGQSYSVCSGRLRHGIPVRQRYVVTLYISVTSKHRHNMTEKLSKVT